jgi:ribosomal protein S9
MNSQQQELRYAASQAFIESLDQLSDRLSQPDPTLAAEPARRDTPRARFAKRSPRESSQFTVQDLEDAVADIEQFTQERSA